MLIDELKSLRDQWRTSAQEFGYGDPHADGIRTGADDLDALIQRYGWQPIETAPKDQRLVLIYCPSEYQGSGSQRVAAYMHFSDKPGWYSHINAIHEPTHWMPLPDPPTEQKE